MNSKDFKDRLKMFNKNSEKEKNTKGTIPKPETKKMNKERFAIFNQNNNSVTQENNSNIKKPNNKVNIFETKVNSNGNSTIPKKDRKQILLEKSSIISDENTDKIIRKYPNLSTAPRNNKILLFIGDNQDAFINTIVNMYSNIDYKDNYRYKIESDNINGNLRTYNIASIADEKDIFIISFPYFNKVEEIFNNEVMKSFIDLLNKKNITNINYLVITIEKKKFLDKKELLFFIFFINLNFDEYLKKRIIILFSSEEENNYGDNNNMIINDIFKDTNDYFLSEENLGFNFNSLFIPEYFYVNNKIIYEKNNDPKEEEGWKSLSEVMKKIQKKISNNISRHFNKNNIFFINKLMELDNKDLTINNIPELIKIDKKREQIIILNYLINSNIKKDISLIILYLFHNIYNNIKLKITQGMKKINFKDIKNSNIDISIFSKIEFNNLESINFQMCALEDHILNELHNLFTSNLVYLNLSENKLTDLQIFSHENKFNNLINLDLSHNNIEQINSLIIGNFRNLKKLNLSHNKISNIMCMDNDLNFNNLKELDLSYNKIIELNRINIQSLKFITLTNNIISEGLINFSDLSYGADELVIENNNNELNFNYSKFIKGNDKPDVYITFTYAIEKNNMNNLLEKVKFKGINKLVLKGFENIDFLINDTLDMLEELDLRNNSINDISIFNNVKFNNKLEKFYLKDNIVLLNGFNSLKKFNAIHFETIYIKHKDDKYICRVIYNTNYEINFIFGDLEFLKDELFLKFKKIDLEQSIWDNNIDFFFKAIQNVNSYPLFKKKATTLTINFKNNKYEVYCKGNEFYSNLNMYLIFNDLNIFKFEFFNVVSKIEFIDVKFDDNIDLFSTPMINLKNISLKNNIIETIKIISIINEMKKSNIIINSDFSNKCDNKIFEFLDDQVNIFKISSKNEDECIINYSLPFNFSICINRKRLNEIKSFKSCHSISLDKMQLTDDDINFLKHDTLLDLKRLTLDENKITNLKFLNKIKSRKLVLVSIKKNLINDGLKYIEDNIKSEKLYEILIKRKSDNENILIFSLNYKGDYQLNYDMLYEVNKNLEILKQINLENISLLNLSNLNLKNIDFLSNKSLSNIEKLNLDNNQIEDISIFSKVHFTKINDLSIENNPIRKGLQVFKSDFFMSDIYINISIAKKENEYKIYTKYNNIKIEFFINNIENIKNIFDFKNCGIQLNTNYIEEIEYFK